MADGIRIAATALAFLAIVGLSTFARWQSNKKNEPSDDPENQDPSSLVMMKPFPSRTVSLLVFAALMISGLMQLVCSLWQHVATVAASSVGNNVTNSAVQFKIGSASIVFGWVSCSLIIITAFGLRLLMDSILVLTEIFDPGSDDKMYIVLTPRE